MVEAWNNTVDLLNWLKVAAPQEIYDEASKTSNAQAAFNMCDHLITELERSNPLHFYARFLKAELFLKIGSKSHALETLSTALILAERHAMPPADDPRLIAAIDLLAKLTPKKKTKPIPPVPADLAGVLAAMHKLCVAKSFNPPCTPNQLELLHSEFSDLPSEVEQIYKDHNGCPDMPSIRRSELSLAAATVAVQNLRELQRMMSAFLKENGIEISETIAWLWFDGAGNYAGIFLSGPHRGAITKYFHEVPEIRAVYPSVYDFMAKVLQCGYMPDEDNRPCDIYMLPETLAR